MNRIAIIPARGGSKRIPRKNIKDFLGKPIIAYSIEAALESEIFEHVFVSTDDDEIAKIATEYGAEVPFLRSKENSNDYAGIAEVLVEFLDRLASPVDVCCCLLPTAPFIQAQQLIEANEVMKSTKSDCIFSAVRFDYPIERALIVSQNGTSSMVWPEQYAKRSQDLEPKFHDAGQFYMIKTDVLRKEGRVFVKNARILEISSLTVQDIDNQEDWSIAELKYRFSFGE